MVKSMKMQRRISNLLIFAVLTFIFVIAIFPVLYTIMGSFKGNMELLTSNSLFPEKFVLDNYIQAWNMANFEKYTMNSIFMSGTIVLGSIFTTTIAGYVFERGKFPGKNLLFGMVISSMFVSLGSLTLYPTYMIAKFFHINTYTPLSFLPLIPILRFSFFRQYLYSAFLFPVIPILRFPLFCRLHWKTIPPPERWQILP